MGGSFGEGADDPVDHRHAYILQDASDGAALRRLREALPGPEHGVYRADLSLFADQAIIEVVRFGDAGITAHGMGATIAEAADACREALG
jgi:hypothetical protein